jgi:glyoxylase-like metal-dependent hydrolase (beta-lactamase superfamily II)
MTTLSRRTVLAGSASTGALLTMAPSFLSSWTSAQAQAAGFNKYKAGSIDVVGIADGVNTFPLPDKFVTNVPKEDVVKALKAAGQDGEKLSIPFNPVAFQNGNRLVVIDTGMGPGMNEKNPAVGNFQKNFAAAGYDATKVTDVVISHFHGDHINGLLTGDGKPTFPNAQVWVGATEWKYWTDDGEASRAPDGRKPAFANVKRVFADGLKNKVTQYDHGKEIATDKMLGTGYHWPFPGAAYVVKAGNGYDLIPAA